jgi:hypothetical protein
VSKRCPPAVVLLLLMESACAGSGPPTAPSSGPSTVPLPGSQVLTGQVIDRATARAIPGATVVFSQPHPSPTATTDSSGRYSLSGLPAPGGGALVWAMAGGFEDDIQYYRAEAQDFRLYPIDLIPAGGSAIVTVRPDDSLCSNNILEPGWGVDHVCRLVRIEPAAGVLTVDAVPASGGSRPTLVAAVKAGTRVLVERQGNPVSVEMSGGTTVVVSVAIAAGSPATQSFTLTTSRQ